MSTSYSPVPVALPATITLPQDLVDQRTAASVNDPLTAVANGVAYLNQSIALTRRMGAGEPVGITQASPTKTYDLKAYKLDVYTYLSGYELFGSYLRQAAVNVLDIGQHVLYDVSPLVVSGSTITRLTLDIIGAAGHVALPSMVPAIGLARYSPSADTWESLLAAGMQNDTSANVASYEAIHDIRLAPDQNNTADPATYVYYAILCPEGGTDGVVGAKFYSWSIRQTASRYQT